MAVRWTSSLAMVIVAVSSPTTAPVTLDTTKVKASLASTKVSPTTLTSNSVSVVPSAIDCPVRASGT